MRYVIALLLAMVLLASACTASDQDTIGVDDAESLPVPTLAADPDEPATFEVVGTRAYMIGYIDADTPDLVADLIENNPGVTTIELVNVPGSADDEANLEAAFMVFEAGIDTHVPANGEIASGGVDFFLAGDRRSFDEGARFGVHSWGTGEPGFNATQLAEDDSEHDKYLNYYDELGVDAQFYWFTIAAAPPEDIHWMTAGELDKFGFATN